MSLAALAQAVIYIAVVIPYLAVGLAVYRYLVPRLNFEAKALASLVLLAQLAAILLSRATSQETGFSYWLWHISKEWNFASALASTQFALVGALALMTAWLPAKRSPWLRLYFIAIAAVFLWFGFDEYAMLHEDNPHWTAQYAVIGGAVALTSLAAAWRSDRRSWVWYGSLVFGLALSGFGATSIEVNALECGGWGHAVLFGHCVDNVILEESLEFLGIWLCLVASLGHFCGVQPLPGKLPRRGLFALPALWMLLLYQCDVIGPVSQRLVATSASASFENGARLHAYRIDSIWRGANLYLSPSHGWHFDRLGLSILMIDQASLEPVVHSDIFAKESNDVLLAPDYAPVFRQVVEVDIPLDTPANRAYWIVLSIWREENGQFQRQKILSSDLPQLGDTQLILDEFRIKSKLDAPLAAPLAIFDNGFVLQDFEPSAACVAPGETIDFTFSWRAEQSGSADLIQFLHFDGSDGAFWNHDQQPLGKRLPTRRWYRGLYDRETWRVTPPAELPEGEYALFTGLYNARDMQRVPARGGKGRRHSLGRFARAAGQFDAARSLLKIDSPAHLYHRRY